MFYPGTVSDNSSEEVRGYGIKNKKREKSYLVHRHTFRLDKFSTSFVNPGNIYSIEILIMSRGMSRIFFFRVRIFFGMQEYFIR